MSLFQSARDRVQVAVREAIERHMGEIAGNITSDEFVHAAIWHHVRVFIWHRVGAIDADICDQIVEDL